MTRRGQRDATRGQVHAIAVTGDGWQGLGWIEAPATMPLAVKGVKSNAHETLGRRALVTQAQRHLTGATRLPTGRFDHGLWAGPAVWGLDPRGLTLVGPAQTTRAGTVEARAQAAAGVGTSRDILTKDGLATAG